MMAQASDFKSGTFHLGDVQEHKYLNRRAFKKGGMPYKETEHMENVHKLVDNQFDHVNGKFLTRW